MMTFFDPSSTSESTIPPGAFVLVLTTEANGGSAAFRTRSALSLIEDIPEIGGQPVFSVLVMPLQVS
jgi:hypothetical protein